MKNKKLVIFDIDGTMLTPLRPLDALQRFRYAITHVFHVDIGEISKDMWTERNFNGMGDRAIIWELIKSHGIHRDMFLDKIGAIGDAAVLYLDKIASDGPLYGMISDAKRLLDRVIEAEHLSIGVLTGNLGQTASWKLHNAGYSDFAFGVYGHEADLRNVLAQLLLPKSKAYFGMDWNPKDIVIIGDTEKDIECAHHIGAISVVVTTGWNVDARKLEQAQPELMVDSLMDERVLSLLGLTS